LIKPGIKLFDEVAPNKKKNKKNSKMKSDMGSVSDPK